MGNRSKLAVAAAGSAFALGMARRKRRRARAMAAGRGFVEDVMPSVLDTGPAAGPAAAGEVAPDEAHAPGHRHLTLGGRIAHEAPPPRVRERPFAKHRHGLRHPGRG